MILRSNWRRLLGWALSGAGVLGCLSGSGPGPRQPDSAATAGTPETLTAAPPAAAAQTTADAAQPPAPLDSTECVSPPDPELDKESDWSKELGQRLDQQLPALARCSVGVPSGDTALVTLRLVYREDGSGVSQHVVSSTPSGCQVVECLKAQLASVRSPRLIIDRASYDISLVLARGAKPQRGSDPPEALTEGPPDEGSCVDPEVARLSRATVRDVVSTRYDELTKCYSRALSRNHSLEGNVSFEFVIGHEGKVAEAQARDASLPDCPAIRCMLDQFRTLEFPPPVGRSVRVIYPIKYVLEQSPMTLQ
jgi:hypothetical protein